MYNDGKISTELWAVMNKSGGIVWSRGGSSSKPKLMVYETEKNAISALRNKWIKQIHGENNLFIKKIYDQNHNITE